MALEIQPGMVIAPLPLTERGFGLHLGGTEKKETRLLYTSTRLVIQRNLDNLTECRICADHAVKATVAKFSPNGEWICSGDDAGDCYVWAHRSFVRKNEIKVGRRVVDISWSGDGQRIFAVGSGKDDKGKVFPWNTNNKLGDITGAQKGFLSCDFKPTRPFRLAAGAEDYGVYMYKGPPFQFESCDRTHKNFVNCVRYRPDGSFYISVGSDKQILVFDGKSGEKVREIVDKKNGHKGTIYEVSWTGDGKQFLTASADKTCKLWDFEQGAVVHTFTFADKPSVSDMQVSCLCLGERMLSVSLSGKINFLQPGEDRPVKVLTGHRKPIQDMVVDLDNDFVYTCDSDSRVVRTECKTGEMEDFIGNPHNDTQIKFVRLAADKKSIFTVGVDDTMARSEVEGLKLSDQTVKLDGAARGVAVGNQNADLAVVVTHKQKLIIFKGIAIELVVDLPFEPTTCALSMDDAEVAVGGADNQIHFFSIPDGTEIAVIKTPLIRMPVCVLSYSPDGKLLASADKNRHIWVWDRTSLEEPLNKTMSFQFHASAPTTLGWSPDSTRLVSGAGDNNIYVWLSPQEGKSDNIHLDSAFFNTIKGLAFLDGSRFIGAAEDSTVRFFDVAEK